MSGAGLELSSIVPHVFDMSRRRKIQKPDASKGERLRRCLLCFSEFVSTWSGNRVCARCRSTSIWKQGA